MNISDLRKKYKLKKGEIRSKLLGFKSIGKRSCKDLFVELCFCLCTPLSKAEKVYGVINQKNKTLLLNANLVAIKKFLRGNCRFHNNKAKYICNARRSIKNLKGLPEDPIVARDFLVKNVKGLGYKEASHFLRNIGYKKLAILDKHILDSLKEFGVIKRVERPNSRKKYLEIEDKMKSFAERVGIGIDELDLLLWSMKTGVVLK